MRSMKLYSWFRTIAFCEGVSFLVLLFIAMPLKYAADLPLAVTIVGALHGILFIAFIIVMILVKEEYKKDLRWGVKAFIASVIPFGTFIMDREWKKEQAITAEAERRGV